MAKHFHSQSIGIDMIQITGPGVDTPSQGFNQAVLNWLLTTLDQAYESGLATANATHTLDKAAEAVLHNVAGEQPSTSIAQLRRYFQTGDGQTIHGPGLRWDVSGMPWPYRDSSIKNLDIAFWKGQAEAPSATSAWKAIEQDGVSVPSITREVYELRGTSPHELCFVFLTINFDDDTITVTPKPWLLPESGERRYPSIGELTDLFAFRDEPDAERAKAIATLIVQAAAFGAQRIAAVRKQRGQAPAPAPAS